MQNKSIPHPLFCGIAWFMLMLAISLVFLSIKYLWAVYVGAEPLQIIGRDQQLSLVLLLLVSFAFGLSVAWIRRHRQRRTADNNQKMHPSGEVG